MVPAIADGGRSFKGAAAYYLHDKKAGTAERVAWVETVNLNTADPQAAWRIMAHTAMAQAELKAAAGIKATGRKLDKPVLVYSLAWHPDERPTKAQQVEAARDTLGLLGLDEHQALIVCHTDEPHAHVHVLVNRVNPGDGRAATLSNSKRILSDWALKYEQAQGKILCPKREENAKKRALGQEVKHPRTPRNRFEQGRAAGNDNLTVDFIRAEQKAKAAALAERQRLMSAAHTRQWEDAKALYAAGKAKLESFREGAAAKGIEDLRPRHSREWADLIEWQRAERRAFRRREGSFLGFVWNAFETVRELRRQELQAGKPDPTAVDALTLFLAVLSSRERRAAFERGLEQERRRLSVRQKGERGEVYRRGRDAHRQSLTGLHKDFMGHCARLRADQARERAEIKAAWRQRKAEYDVAMAPILDRAAKWRRVEQLGRGQDRGRSMARERSLQPPKPKP